MIRLEGVGLRYDGAEVLTGLSFSVPAGGFRWLLGPSGAGKSSLLALLHLAARPSRGKLHLLGAEISATRRRDLPRLRRMIGMVFQDFRLLGHLTVFDNVALPLRLAGQAEAQTREDVVELLRWVGLAGRAGDLPAALSGGEQQRVAIARSVVARPQILLADEPTGNLDDEQAEQLMLLLREMNRIGTTVIVATHSEALVARHPGAMLVMEAGRLVHDGPG